jgi:hypothetical protein
MQAQRQIRGYRHIFVGVQYCLPKVPDLHVVIDSWWHGRWGKDSAFIIFSENRSKVINRVVRVTGIFVI